MNWLMEEFIAAADAAKPEHFDTLISKGVSSRVLYDGAMRFGVAPIATDGASYRPAANGKTAFIMPEVPLPAPWEDRGFRTYTIPSADEDLGFPVQSYTVADDDIGDLIAWFPNNPAKWWLRTEAARVLNPDALDRAWICREPLALWSTPFDWLRGGAEGAVILDKKLRLPFYLGGIGQVVCENVDLAKQLRGRAQRQERVFPDFRVRADALEHA